MRSEDDAAGAATDSRGRAVLDPTKNVLDLVEAAIQRQDDLRDADARHIREIAAIRAEHARELRAIETARLDAIRANDQSAVQRAADVAQTASNALAATVNAAAEANRTQVAAAAAAQEARLLAALDPVQKDIADLRRSQYEAQGQKTQVVETHARTGNTGLWIGLILTGLFGLAGMVAGALGLLLAFSR